MKAEILGKLKSLISTDIDTESKVVYLLAEVRKFLDSTDKAIIDEFPNIYFYANWVLHIKMNRSPARKILKRFETYVHEDRSLKEISHEFIIKEARFYLFYDLRDELDAFFKLHNLKNKMLTTEWPLFTYLLVEILTDCPLINDESRVYEFSFLHGKDDRKRFRVRVKGKGSFKISVRD